MFSVFKLFIFDLDGTLYDIRDLIEANFEIETMYLNEKHGYSINEAKKLLNDNGVFPYVSKDAKSCSQLFRNMGISMNDWNKYRNARFEVDSINPLNSITNDMIKFFKNMGDVVLITNNTDENTIKIFKHLNIDKNLFSEIITNACKDTDSFSKQEVMAEVINKYGVKPNEVLGIGDRYNIDVLPLLKLKGHGVVLNKPTSLKRVIKEYASLKTCEDYYYE